jgi:hypothetical protein
MGILEYSGLDIAGLEARFRRAAPIRDAELPVTRAHAPPARYLRAQRCRVHFPGNPIFYRELVESVRVPPGREVGRHDYSGWLARLRQGQAFKKIDAIRKQHDGWS